jgi:hypothetical protein
LRRPATAASWRCHGDPVPHVVGAASDHFTINGCAGLDSGSQVIKNKLLIAREIGESGAHVESAERKLNEMC